MRDYDALLCSIRTACKSNHADLHDIGSFTSAGRGYTIVQATLGNPSAPRVMIDAGIHGDEPGGVEAAVRFLESSDGDVLSRFHFTVFPCNNPSGWERNTRENADGVDLNRCFSTRNPPVEVELISSALQGRCYELVFEMHEDVDAQGFYVYELVDDPALLVAPAIVSAVASMGYPVNASRSIEGRSARGGVIAPSILRFRKTRLPLAIYAYRTCGGRVLTMEPPASVLDIEDRVRIQHAALRLALGAIDGLVAPSS